MKIYLRILSVFSLCILCSADGYGAGFSTNVAQDGYTMKHDTFCLNEYNKLKDKRTSTKENNEIIKAWKNGFRKAGMKNVGLLDLSKFDMTGTKDILDDIHFEDYDLSKIDARKTLGSAKSSSELGSLIEKLFTEENLKQNDNEQ